MSSNKTYGSITTDRIYGMGVVQHDLPGMGVTASFPPEVRIGNQSLSEKDIADFRKMLGFLDFALAASEELRNLMVAYEAKQRILK